ncbi:ATP-binding protein [Virgibacillus necropolis]|uniref:ATP-binding protein n=1 Tax=Virgibacillus necropolis TaxID=163877 RepID=UPI00384C00DC
MRNINKKVGNPKQGLIKTYICQSCHQEVERKELVIPIGPFKGEKTIVDFGCKCEDIKLAEQTKRSHMQLKQDKLINSFNYYSLINDSLKSATIENYKPTSIELKKAKKMVSAYIDAFDGKHNLLLTGNYGTGKSHLSISITKELMELGYHCLFVSLPKLLTKIKRTYNKEGVTEDELLDFIRQVDLLVIDDIGSEQQTEWSTSKLFEIFDDRTGKATIYTTNLNSTELKKRVNERNFSRMMENTEVVVMNGTDYRRREF